MFDQLLILGQNRIFFFRILQIGIQILPINSSHSRDIFRALHTSFDFEGINTCLDQLRQDRQRIHILETERILLFAAAFTGVWQPARACTASPVAASPTQNGAQETLARICIAHRTMNKTFDFQMSLFFHLFDLIQ